MTTIILVGMLFLALALAATGWLAFYLIRQYGRLLLRLEAVEQRLTALGAGAASLARAEGLPVGTPAPDFDLPDLDGNRHRLAEFRGRPVALVFFNPRCGFCAQMVPELAKLPAAGCDGGPVPIIITTGDVETNRRMLIEGGVRCPVLVQEKKEVAERYEVRSTPTGYLIDEQGLITSPLTRGAQAVLELAGAAPAVGGEDREAQSPDQQPRNGKFAKGLAASRLIRDGLKAGTVAPSFTLPRLDGGELSLDDYRGRQVLLVFSDPECGPCEAVAPHLERLHRSGTGPEVVMVSRRTPEANRRKADALGLTFPIVLQQGWEISLRYGMFATPIGYLINEDGIIAADVATGVEAIRTLMSEASGPLHNRILAVQGGNGREVAMR